MLEAMQHAPASPWEIELSKSTAPPQLLRSTSSWPACEKDRPSKSASQPAGASAMSGSSSTNEVNRYTYSRTCQRSPWNNARIAKHGFAVTTKLAVSSDPHGVHVDVLGLVP